MKQLLIIISILTFSCFLSNALALNVIEDTNNTTPITPYVSNVELPSQKNEKNIFQAVKDQKSLLEQEQQAKTNNAKNLIFPVTSDFTVGAVNKHKLKITQHLPNKPIFVIGDDQKSISWSKTNAEFLKKIGAVGIITNVPTLDRVKKIEADTGLMLIPANVEGLSRITGSKNYPFLIYKGWILQ